MFVNNKYADQPVHLRSLISAFAIQLLENVISKQGCKDQESIQSNTTPDSQINRRAQRHNKHKIEKKHQISTKEVPPWNGQ